MWDKGGIPLMTFISNYNNGSSYDSPYEGGVTSSVKEIYTKLTSPGTYFKSVQIFASPSQNISNTPYAAQHLAAIEATVNEGNTRLYGIDENGVETLIKDHVKYAEIVEINDTQRNYVELVLKFENPVVLDNDRLKLRERQWFTSDEMQNLANLNDGEPSYTSLCSVTSYNKKEDKFVKGEYKGNVGGGLPYATYFTVRALHPVVDQYVEKPQTIEYKADATFDYMVGPKLPRYVHDRTPPYGDLTHVKNVKVITLLPGGYEYTGEYQKYIYDSDWNRNPIAEPEITTLENYNGSGKTAVVVNYGDIKIATHYPIKLKLRATKYAPRGESKFENYLLYDDNDFILPIAEENYYKDELDLDGDGDNNETFMKNPTLVTLVPPLELIINNTVKYDGEYNQSVTGDLGYEIQNRIDVFNNSIVDVKSLSVIDVLPFVGDHSISPNADGEYPQRDSTFRMTLTGALEDVNGELNEKLQFFYQTTEQGDDIESVRDGVWKTKDEIDDFSQVRSVKIVLREGQVLKTKEVMDIIIPAAIPKDTSLDEATARAFNSSAFSTDGKNYTEGNKTRINFATYQLSGKAYLDLNKNGRFDGEDIPQKNIGIKLLNKDGSQALDFNNKPIVSTTDEEGNYSIPVYKRGKYVVSFTKDEKLSFNTETFGTEGNTTNNSILADSTQDNSAKTGTFTLYPAHKRDIKNVALLPNIGQINITKVSADEKEADGSQKKIAGVTFTLKTKGGAPVQNYKGEIIQNVTTDSDGKAVFENVPYGEYIVEETNAPVQYVVNTEKLSAVISDDTNVNVTDFVVENSLKKGDISIHKTDSTKRLKPLAGVEFTLYKGNEKIESKLTDENGNVKFEKLPYGDYSLKETKGIDGYEISDETVIVNIREDGKEYHYNVENKLINPKIELKGQKVWKDDENRDRKRPDEVTVHLFANGKDTGKTTKAAKLSDWTYTFKDLDTYDENGDKINYTVTEDKVDGYETAIDKTTITNTHTPQVISVSVEKVWIDNENAKELRPDSVIVTLYADGEKVGEKELTAAENWKFTFENLLKYKASKEIEYTVSEQAVDNYSAEYSGDYKKGLVVTNTIEGKISVSVTKKWNVQQGKEAEIKLLKDGEEADKITITAKDEWKHTFEDLDLYDKKDGHEYEYTVAETNMPGYSSKIKGNQNDGFEVTNTYEPTPVTVNPIAKKKVKGHPGKPEKFTFRLKSLADGNPMPDGSVENVKTVKIKGSGEIEFGNIRFNLPGVYSYEIREKDGKAANYSYDKSVYIVTFNVKDVDGKLTAEQTIEKAGKAKKEVTFTNVYSRPANAVPDTSDTTKLPMYLLMSVLSAVSLAAVFRRKLKISKLTK
jgi:pilin isopeptide linkage protein